MRMLSVVLGLVIIGGCDEGTLVCTTEAAFSVNATVALDTTGGPLSSDAHVTYSVDDGEFKDCEDFGNGAYACGMEEAGRFEIRASQGGYTSDTKTVEVSEGECHVSSETVELVLAHEDPMECTENLAPSVIIDLRVQGWSYTPGYGATVVYAVDGGEFKACDAEDVIPDAEFATYFCGWEEVGEFTYKVSGDSIGETTGTAVIGLSDDGCHVETEEISLTVDCLIC